jgi:hypothetical protein
MRETQQSGRRSQRGPRRRHRGEHKAEPPRTAPARKTFWEKIKAFFMGNGTAKVTREVNGSRRRSETNKGSRRPEVVEVSSPKVYVGNLSFDAVESDLFDLFNGVGQVQNAEVVSHKHTQKSKGFAFVTMSSTEEAKRAVEVLHDKEFMGRKLVVSGAKTNDLRHVS